MSQEAFALMVTCSLYILSIALKLFLQLTNLLFKSQIPKKKIKKLNHFKVTLEIDTLCITNLLHG